MNTSRELLPIPPTELSPAVPPLQAKRMDMQRGLLTGWNSWWSTIGAKPGYRGGMLAVALLLLSGSTQYAHPLVTRPEPHPHPSSMACTHA